MLTNQLIIATAKELILVASSIIKMESWFLHRYQDRLAYP